jgi:hypothetical protein
MPACARLLTSNFTSMKLRSILVVACLVIATGAVAAAADNTKPPVVYSSADAAKHIGETATIEGVVSSTRELPSGQAFLNFGAPFPNHDFTAVIFRSTERNSVT